MTKLIPCDAALKIYTDWTIGPEEAIAKLRAIPAIDPAAIREAAMREAAVAAYQFEGNDKLRLHILAMIGEKK